MIQYERIRLPNAGNEKLPYGEYFTTALNEDGTSYHAAIQMVM